MKWKEFALRIQKLMENIDLFGQSVQFHFQDKYSFKTSFGGTISLILICFFIILFYRQLIDLFTYQNFTIDSQEIVIFDPPQQIITNQDFQFAMRIENSGYNDFPKFFEFVLYQKIYSKEGSSPNFTDKQIEVKLETCTMNHFKYFKNIDLEKQFQSLDLKNYLCPQINSSFNFSGTYQAQHFEFLKIELRRCIENCASEEQFQNFLATNNFFKLSFIMTNHQLNPSAKDSLEMYLSNEIYYEFTPSNMIIRSDIFLRKIDLTEDFTLVPLLSNKEYHKVYSILYEDLRTSLIIGSKQNLCGQFYMRLSSKSKNIVKNYVRIDRLMAYIGGLLKFGIVIIGWFVGRYNLYYLYIELANQVYDFDLSNQEQRRRKKVGKSHYKQMKQKISDKMNNIRKAIVIKSSHQERNQESLQMSQEQNSKMIQFRKMQSIKISEQSSQDLKNKEDTEFQIMDRNSFLMFVFKELVSCKKNIKMKAKYLFSKLSFSKLFFNSETQLIDKGVNMIKRDLDINILFSRIQQIDKLKQIVLNQKQILLFDYTPKPLIQIAEKSHLSRGHKLITLGSMAKRSFIYEQYSEMRELYQAYEHLMEKSLLDSSSEQINQKIFQLLGEELKDIFEFTIQLPSDIFAMDKNFQQQQQQQQQEPSFPSQEKLISVYEDESSAQKCYHFVTNNNLRVPKVRVMQSSQ